MLWGNCETFFKQTCFSYLMIKAIIFDMGGVVLNAKIETAYEILAKKLKVSKARFDAVKINTFEMHRKAQSLLKIFSIKYL